MKHAIGIPMQIDPAPFLANLFLYSYEEKYMSLLISSEKIKGRHFHSTKRLIDDLCATNEGGEFIRTNCEIYSEKPELKVEYRGRRATFLNPFSIFNCKNASYRKQYPTKYFYSAIKVEFLRIARSALCLIDFIPKDKELLEHM